MKEVVIIPARYKSSRFPGKPLAKIAGIPMILRVAEVCSYAVPEGCVYVATDDDRIAELVKAAGYNLVMTSSSAITGTDRLAEAAGSIDADIYVNVQGDEPLIHADDIKKILEQKRIHPNDVINGYCKIGKGEHPENKNIPKVIFTEKKKMVYMSRNLIPDYKDDSLAPKSYFKQVCIYAFAKDELLAYGRYGKKSYLEEKEDIEILRFLEIEKTVRMVELKAGSLAVDIPSDILKVEDEIRRREQ